LKSGSLADERISPRNGMNNHIRSVSQYKVMRTELVLSLFLGVVLSSILLEYPPTYYIYLFHEILLIIIFLWFIDTILLKKYSKSLEIVTFFLLFLFLLLSPITTLLAPDYDSHFEKDPLSHVDYLVNTIGERPYGSENEQKAAEYIRNTLEKKGFSPVTDENVVVVIEGKKKEAVIFCAHYDTVPGSPGADDNASGVSVLLELDIPDTPEYTIILACFTGEECGFVGSQYFADTVQREIVAVICVDTVGLGEDFHISSFKENRFQSFFLSQVVYALSDSGVPSIGPLYSDHVPFNQRGIKAIGLTRSFDRKYPHIHSEEDITVLEDKLIETGKTVQEVIIHFSYSKNPYLFVYRGMILAVIGSGVLAVGVQTIMDRFSLRTLRNFFKNL
jgi:hypothetical protein